MAQDNDAEITAKFSTLNVNAMEFVPTFCTSERTSSTTDDEIINDEKSPENNGN